MRNKKYKPCKICSFYKRKGKLIPKHNCKSKSKQIHLKGPTFLRGPNKKLTEKIYKAKIHFDNEDQMLKILEAEHTFL
jgi:hypothetical protein